MKRGHHFPVFFIPKKLMLKGFVIVLVLMPFSNKKSTIDLQRKDVYEVLLCILKRSCPRTFGLLFDLCSFVPKHLASQYIIRRLLKRFGKLPPPQAEKFMTHKSVCHEYAPLRRCKSFLNFIHFLF